MLLIVEDDRRVARALARMIATRLPDVWTAHSAAAARARLRSSSGASVAGVLADFELGDATGLDVIREARALTPELPALILTGHGSDELANACAAERITYVTKPCTVAALEPFLERVALHESFASIAASEVAATAREGRVLALVRDGLTQQEVAEALGVELSTVRKHASNLLIKARRRGVNVASLAELARALGRASSRPPPRPE
ncbi:MAG: response regulator transcription factor [Sandaracinaceae bacterium]|nr:response regulator transcription factor [Sandaracinaceae bacterium]